MALQLMLLINLYSQIDLPANVTTLIDKTNGVLNADALPKD